MALAQKERQDVVEAESGAKTVAEVAAAEAEAVQASLPGLPIAVGAEQGVVQAEVTAAREAEEAKEANEPDKKAAP